MNRNQRFDRRAGILMPVSSLPSPYGIGTFGREAMKFVDFIAECGHSYWQVLPLGQTSYGDSPYQSFSAFAGNPYFIDLDILVDEGLLTKEYIESFDWGDDEQYVDYGKMFNSRYKVLKTAYKKFRKVAIGTAFESFKQNSGEWLEEYALYMACKEYFGYKAWSEWDDDIRFRKEDAVKKYRKILSDEVDFWMFCQYEFFKQWNKLKEYANSKQVEIIGDIPIYVALDSADVWAHPEVFQLDENLTPKEVAGVPPDAFTDLGQKWGNPLYDWETLEADDFGWWRKRMSAQAKMYDVIRID
ncbi:MAG: 4-alpha-glucanotransferase, partial [Bacteroides sp.]